MKQLLAMVAVAILCVACAGDDMPPVPAADKIANTPIAFQVGATELTAGAESSAESLASGAMGFFMQTANTDYLNGTTIASKYNGSNRKVEFLDGKWQVAGYPLLWHSATDEVAWQAYYPYDENTQVINGIIPLVVPTNQDTGEVNDFLSGMGKTTGVDSSTGVKIQLKHQMAKLIVKLTIGAELGDVGIKSVVIGGMNTEWAFNILKGRWDINSSITTPANISMLKDLNDASGKTFEAIILPLNPDQFNIDITTTDNRKFYYKRGNTDFKEGQVHTLNLKLGKDKTKMTSLSTTDWQVERQSN